MKWATCTGPCGNVIWYGPESGVVIAEATESERGRFGAEKARTLVSRASPVTVRETVEEIATTLGAKGE